MLLPEQTWLTDSNPGLPVRVDQDAPVSASPLLKANQGVRVRIVTGLSMQDSKKYIPCRFAGDTHRANTTQMAAS